MNKASAGIKVGLTAIVVAIIGWIAFRFVAKGISGEEGYEVWALFRDATGLVDKSRVQVAGLTIGEIKDRRLQGQMARVTLRIRPDTQLFSNAAVYKKTASLLGEFYLEIDPGTEYTPDPLTGQNKKNYLLKNCFEVTHKPDCNQIANVVEAVTAGDILVQVNETLPVLRDILMNVRKMTEGPVQEMLKQVQEDIERNARAIEKLLDHIDRILDDVSGFTRGQASQEIREAITNVRDITKSVKNLVGEGEGQVTTTGDKVRHNLDKLASTLDNLNSTLMKADKITTDVSEITDRVNRGEGSVGRLLKDDAIAENITSISDDAAGFIRSITRLQTIVGIRTEYNFLAENFKTYLSIKLMPRPDKYYLIEVVDDPRGSRSFSHETQVTTVGTGGGAPTVINTDKYSRTPAFRFTFMLAKRMEPWGRFGITGRIGIKESTGGLGLDLDFWKQRLVLNIDLFDFLSGVYPRLKVWAALELFKHVWLTAGVDDILNRTNDPIQTVNPGGTPLVTCGPTTPDRWCLGGRDYFVGAMLSFNDEDLRALLTIGGGALAGAAR